jgi:chemosensory pili system protein ChpA (sensor histidine kinase/response regulator)
MSLRTALTAFGSVLKQSKSSTPLSKALKDFARAVDPKTAKQKFPAQQRALTKLAQRMLTSASAAGEEDSKIIGDVCTLIAAALTQQVRAEARASDDDWRWLALCPDKLLDCDAGSYDEAEALVRHLLECPWAESLSPDVVIGLLDRLKALSDAPDVPSAKLMPLYEQYCIQHQAGEEASIRQGREDVSAGPENINGVEKSEGLEKTAAAEKTGGAGNTGEVGKRRRVGRKRGVGKVRSVENRLGGGRLSGLDPSKMAEARKEDASIAADGAGLAADNAEVQESEMDLPIIGYVPALDVAGDDASVMHEYSDTNIFAITGTDMSGPVSSRPDTLVFDTSVVDAEYETARSDSASYDVTVFDTAATATAVSNTTVIDVTATDAATPDTAVIDTTVADDALLDTTVIDPTLVDPGLPASTVQLEGESPVVIAPDVAAESSEGPPVDQNVTGGSDETAQSTATLREPTRESAVKASNDDARRDDELAGDRQGNNEPREARHSIEALFSRVPENGDSQHISNSNSSSGRDVGALGLRPAQAGILARRPDFLVPVQLPLPGMKVPESVGPDETAVASRDQRLLEAVLDEMVGLADEIHSARDEATIDMFDEMEAALEDENVALEVAVLTAPADAESVDTVTSDPNAGDEIAITSGDIERIDDDRLEIESFVESESAIDGEKIGAHALTAPDTREDSNSGEPTTEAVPSQGQEFNALGSAALGDEHDDRDSRGDHDALAINLYGFVLEDASTIGSEDASVVDAFADVEKPELLAGVQLPLIGFESQNSDAVGTDEADDAEAGNDETEDVVASAEVGDPVVAPAGDERNESAASIDDIFDAFDGTVFENESDNDVVGLDEYVLGGESPTINDDAPAADELAAGEQPRLLANTQLPLIDSEHTRNDVDGTSDAGNAVAAIDGEQRNGSAPVLDGIFDAFDGTAFRDDFDDDAVILDEHLLADESPIVNDDVSAADGFAAESMRARRIESNPAPGSIFDAFDDDSLGDEIADCAVNLDEFLLTEDVPANINQEVPSTGGSVDVEQPGKLASMRSPVSASEDASKGSTGAGVADDTAGSVDQSSVRESGSADRKLSRAATQIVEVLLAELPNVEVELAICSNMDQSSTIDHKGAGETMQRRTEVLERFGLAADSVGFVGIATIFGIASEHVRSVAQVESQSDTQVRLLARFADLVRVYFNAPFKSDSAQSLIDWAVDDGWPSPATINEREALLCLLTNPDMSAVDEDAPVRQKRGNMEDVSLAVPADVNGDLLDGLLQELPVQCEEFSAAIERLMRGTGGHEDILVAQRIAHTIKGSGNTVGIRGLATLTHNIEDILLVLAQEKRLPSQPLADMLMNAADRLQVMTESLLGMGPPPEDALEVLQCVLDWANMIDREGLPVEDATPQSLPELVGPPLMRSSHPAAMHSDDVEKGVPVPANEATQSVVEEQSSNEARKTDLDKKVDQEQEALLRVPARLIDELLTSAGESIILTGQLRDRVRRALADWNAMSFQFERQQQLGGELEKLIDIKDFSRLQAQNDNRFDALEMDQYNELHSAARQLVESATDAREMGHALVEHLSSLDEMLISQEDLSRDTQDTVLHTRMVSVKTIFARLQRAVRQTCRATAKQVELHLSGGDTPMDSDALIRIVDPLMHLLRNAIDHGIEDAETRLRGGKSATGNIYVEFQREGNDVVINCRDDGGGLNYDAIRHAAEDRGLIGPDVSLDALKQLILRANFSTRAQASQVSGRGIGLDAVHNSVLALGGTMTVESETGHGCDFKMRLPFNLISSHALLVRSGPNVVALASRGVKQIVHSSDGELRRFGDKVVFQVGDNMYPATTLEAIIGDKEERRDGGRRSRPVVLAHTDEGVTAVSVESVIGSRDLVVKSLGKLLPKFRGVVGATILGDGQVAPVIDLPDMLSNRDVGVDLDSMIATDSPADSNSGFVLVVDDSLSARRALVQFMEDSGYRVRTARDGMEAAKLLEGAKPDLVLADLEMPRMNGIELTVHLRATAETADVPVIMITSRSTTKHREQAQSAGVNAYITKPYSENALIETVRGLIREQEIKRNDRPAA